MPKPNYKYDKRQRDIAKKKKQDEKRLKKLEKGRGAGADTTTTTPDAGTTDATMQQHDA